MRIASNNIDPNSLEYQISLYKYLLHEKIEDTLYRQYATIERLGCVINEQQAPLTKFRLMMVNRHFQNKVLTNYKELMSITMDALDKSSILCLQGIEYRSMTSFGLEAFKMSLQIQLRRDQLKRAYILKRYKRNLQVMGTFDLGKEDLDESMTR